MSSVVVLRFSVVVVVLNVVVHLFYIDQLLSTIYNLTVQK